MARPDLSPLCLNELSWVPEDYGESIRTLAGSVRAQVQTAIGWYLQAKKPKKRGAIAIRSLAILFTSAAGISPILAQSRLDLRWLPEILREPMAVTLFIAVAAALIGFDRFFGFSRAWIRYITAELKIRILLDEFNMDWPLRMAEWAGGHPDQDQAKAAMMACKDFLSAVNSVVAAETDQWVADFQSSLRELDEASKAAAQAARVAEAEARRERERAEEEGARTGALNVTVLNAEQLEGGWLLTIDDGGPQRCDGKTAGVLQLRPGPHRLVARGTINGLQKHAELVTTIQPNAVAECSLTLE